MTTQTQREIPITMRQLHILQHSLGVDEFGRGNQYRNHFATGAGSVDYGDCNALVDAGLMEVQRAFPLAASMDCFWVTDAGKCYVAENSPKPPQLTRSQQRYRRYLESDGCFDSFRDFLRWESKQQKHLPQTSLDPVRG